MTDGELLNEVIDERDELRDKLNTALKLLSRAHAINARLAAKNLRLYNTLNPVTEPQCETTECEGADGGC